MFVINYTDVHCDTAVELYKAGAKLEKNRFHVDMEKARSFDRYSQVFAIWSENNKKDDENYADFFKIRHYLLDNLRENNIVLCKTGEQYKDCCDRNAGAAVLAVEGGKLIAEDLSRLEVLYQNDVRIFTLVWGGLCSIGGAFDTSEGLTPFGRKVITELNRLNIVIDVSHASEKMVCETLEITSKPIIASHSSSRAIHNHRRNLTDAQFCEIKRIGGVVGINLYCRHIAENSASLTDALRHIEHYLSLGGEEVICFGGDFDGAELIDGIKSLSDMTKFADEFVKLGYSGDLIKNIMYANADRFMINNI